MHGSNRRFGSWLEQKWLLGIFSAALAASVATGCEQNEMDVDSTTEEALTQASLNATLSTSSNWAAGYCLNLTLQNTGAATTAWQVGLNMNSSSATMQSNSNGVYTLSGGQLTVKNMSYNGAIAAGASTTASFCINRTDGSLATVTSVTATRPGSTGAAGSGGTAGTGAGGYAGGGSTGAAGAAGTTGTGGVTAPAAASGSGTTCDKVGTIAAGSYFAQNNVWNSGAGAQCISLSGTNLTVTSASHNLSPNTPPYSPACYASFVRGCHYGLCTDTFPRLVSATTKMPSSFSIARAAGTWDAAYDIWLDPTARTNGANTGLEIMIWADYSGSPQPIGSQSATVTIAGTSWQVWLSNGNENGSSRTISYRRGTGNTSIMNFDAMAFVNDAVARGVAQKSWYITSVQAGFEIWNGGAGLKVTTFSIGAQ